MYDQPQSVALERGELFLDHIYGKVVKRVVGSLDWSGTEDLGLAARLAYGHILSNTAILSPMETSFVLIAGLIPQDVSNPLPESLSCALPLF